MQKIQAHDLISIIVLNHNGEKFIKKCLQSVTTQTYKSYEVIVVDNASTDSSRKIIEAFPSVRKVYNKVGRGFAGGNNAGIAVAKGKYVVIVSNDTWMEKQFLSKLVSEYNKLSCDVISPREAEYSSDGKKHKFYWTTIDPFGHNVFTKNNKFIHKQPFYLTGVCMLFPKKLYQDTGMMDEDFFLYCEDVDWCWRLQLFDKTYKYADNVFIHHSGAGSTGGAAEKAIKYQVFLWRNQNTLQMLLKNYAAVNLLWVLPIYFLQNIAEMIFFLLLGKPTVAITYLAGWVYNVKKLPRTLHKRSIIQKKREVSDRYIIDNMYKGSGKIFHLYQYYFEH